jgi:hypothetical protein
MSRSSPVSRQPASITRPTAPRARNEVASKSPNMPSVFPEDVPSTATSPGVSISAATCSIQLSPGCAKMVTAVPQAAAPG